MKRCISKDCKFENKGRIVRGLCHNHYFSFGHAVRKGKKKWADLVAGGLALERRKTKPPRIKVPGRKSGGQLTLPLEEIFALRREGHPSTWIAVKYNCDTSTLFYHFKKHNIKPKGKLLIIKVPKIEKREKEVKVKLGSSYAFVPVFEKPKSYKDYIRESKERAEKRKRM